MQPTQLRRRPIIDEHALVRSLFEHWADLVTLIDDEGTVLFDSDSVQEVLGYAPHERIGSSGLSLIHPADRSRAEAAMGRLTGSERAVGPVEVRVLRADGSWAELEWQGLDLRDRPGIGAIVATARDVSERNRNRRKLERQVEGLLALQRVDVTTSSPAGIDETLRVLLVEAMKQLASAGAAVLVVRQDPERLEVHTSIGARSPRHPPGLRGDPAVEVLHKRRPVLRTCSGGSAPLTVVAVPLVARGTGVGALELVWTQPRPLESGDLMLLQAFASRAAIAIDDQRLWNALRRSQHQLEVAYDRTLEGWVRALDLRDHETEGHTQRVTEVTLRLARRFGFAGQALVHLRRGAMLHDIGKLAIPDQILLKPGRLSPDERVVIEQHPAYARRFLDGIEYLQPALDIPYAHHERWDGAGYPLGLAGDEIPFAARIFAIVDVWDALRSDRPYRRAWPDSEVRRHLAEQSGRHFDPQVVVQFLELLDGDPLVSAPAPAVASGPPAAVASRPPD